MFYCLFGNSFTVFYLPNFRGGDSGGGRRAVILVFYGNNKET